MNATNNNSTLKTIRLADWNDGTSTLDLILDNDGRYRWYAVDGDTEVSGATMEEAMEIAQATWGEIEDVTKTLTNGIYGTDNEVYTVIDGQAWITASADVDRTLEIKIEDIPTEATRIEDLLTPEEIAGHYRAAQG